MCKNSNTANKVLGNDFHLLRQVNNFLKHGVDLFFKNKLLPVYAISDMCKTQDLYWIENMNKKTIAKASEEWFKNSVFLNKL